MAATIPRHATTAERILDVTERLVQTRGFNGFSYADVAAELRITKASLHYHFPTKADLGTRVIERYHERFDAALAALAEGGRGAREKLRAYAALYASVLRKNRLCLCGMLASDHATLPRSMKEAVNRFFDVNDRWVGRVLEEGRAAGELRFDGDPIESARALVASLEGAMLVARAYGDVKRFESASERLLAQLGAAGA